MNLEQIRRMAGYFGAGLMLGSILSAYNRWVASETEPLRSLLAGDGTYYTWRDGRIFYKVRGEGPPLLLLHSIHASASGWEMRKQHEHFAANGFRVYTPDLLGFGLSTRPDRRYAHATYTALVRDFVRDVIQAPATVIASSLSTTFVVAAAAEAPGWFNALVLIQPVGVERCTRRPVWGYLVEELLRAPAIGQTLFNLLVSRPALNLYARHRLYLDGDHVTDEFLGYHHSVSHQPRARYAPAAFFGGALHRSIRDEFARITVPLFLAWAYQATDAPTTDGPAFLRISPRAMLAGFDAKQRPHEEAAPEFNRQVLRWLQRHVLRGEELESRPESLELRVVL